VAEVTSIRGHAVMGNFRFATEDGQLRGAVLGKRLAEQLNAWPGDRLTVVTRAGVQLPIPTHTRHPHPHYEEFPVTGNRGETGMYDTTTPTCSTPSSQAQRWPGWRARWTADVRTERPLARPRVRGP
jgi:lipoprotein-releasing system permease protein